MRISRILKILPIVAMCVACISSQSHAAPALTFDSQVLSGTDDQASFTDCTLQLRGRIDGGNPLTMLQVVLRKHANGSYFFATGLATRPNTSSDWLPINSVLKWIRVGMLEPIVLEPFNLITTPAQGSSGFTMSGVPKVDYLAGIRDGDAVWVQIFNKVNQSKVTLTGTIVLEKSTATMLTQCLKNLPLEKR